MISYLLSLKNMFPVQQSQNASNKGLRAPETAESTPFLQSFIEISMRFSKGSEALSLFLSRFYCGKSQPSNTQKTPPKSYSTQKKTISKNNAPSEPITKKTFNFSKTPTSQKKNTKPGSKPFAIESQTPPLETDSKGDCYMGLEPKMEYIIRMKLFIRTIHVLHKIGRHTFHFLPRIIGPTAPPLPFFVFSFIHVLNGPRPSMICPS